ncbi:MAG: hypothetical protein GDA39_07975 [Hyphomonadaceae bacterium]|nr:hypothetical protein [Hyphomonadaceae bacterium]MBC6412800.1 hypothetical protein [Hyphomonadaceae bacterium]
MKRSAIPLVWGLWWCEAVLDVECCTELIELMLTGGCLLAQAEKAIREFSAIFYEDSFANSS